MVLKQALQLLLSFLRFVAKEAPELAPEVAKLVTRWASLKNIPNEELQPALDPSVTDEHVADADREADALIDQLWPKPDV
jgi:hypothetical protein